MKLELPLAIVLLAIGGWLWISHFPSQGRAKSDTVLMADMGSSIDPPSKPSFQQLANSSGQELASPSPVQQASFHQPLNASPFGDFEPGLDDPGLLLAQAAKQMEMSPPISCKARCQINLFNQSLAGEGFYHQAGQGSGLTRLEMNYRIDDQTNFQSTQICDGKFHYWIQQLHGQRTIEFIDLSELKSNQLDVNAGPAQWLTRTGTVSLLKNLSAAFEFEKPIKTTLGNHDMLLLKGKWKPESIQNLLYGQFQKAPENGIAWNRLPNQLPHAVEVYLGTDDFLNLFPYRLSFFQFDGDQLMPDPMMTMELYEVQKVSELPKTLFRVNANGSQQVDLSSNYSEHLQRMSEAAAETINR